MHNPNHTWLLHENLRSIPVDKTFKNLSQELKGFQLDLLWKMTCLRTFGDDFVRPGDYETYDGFYRPTSSYADLKLGGRSYAYISHDERVDARDKYNTVYAIYKEDDLCCRLKYLINFEDSRELGILQCFLDGSWVRSRYSNVKEAPWSIDLRFIDENPKAFCHKVL